MRSVWCALFVLAGCTERLPVLERPPEPPPSEKPCTCGNNELCAVDRCVNKSELTRLSVGVRHACRIDDGILACWGENRQGQLGLGDSNERMSPTRVGDGSSWLEVAAAEEHTCAIAAPGRLYCWGNNRSGQLGTGEAAGQQNAPTRVASVYDDFEHVFAGGDSTCAFRGGGTLYCWGATGELLAGTGDIGTPEVVDEPVIVLAGSKFTEVSLGSDHACAVRDDGALLCWGQNVDGQLGIGMASDMTKQPTEVGNDTDWEHVAAGQHHTCGIRGGDLYCWGRGDSGELGIPNRRRNSALSPARVTDMGGWEDIAVSAMHSCAIAANTRVWCWGRNSEGQLGMTPSNPVLQPTQVAMMRFSRIGCGATFTCGVNTGQTLLCWGANDEGQLGTGDHVPQSTPTAVDD
jgi:alpha-tubulin suppressor-like RCC1 family protein